MATENGPVLFLAWQDAASRRWYPIGRLSCEGGIYRYVYVAGFTRAASEAGLAPPIGFPDIDREYRSDRLFPLFANRVMSSSRSDYGDYLARLNIADGPTAPLEILARQRGSRPTDPFEVFLWPLTVTEEGPRFRATFFVHGLRHGPRTAQARAAELLPGDPLLPMPDWCNSFDPHAIALRTVDKHIIGFVPRYYAADLMRIHAAQITPTFAVERVNPPPAPTQERVLCRVDAAWRAPTPPLSDGDYRPLA
ncbi:MAG: DNA-binding protein [Myxococcota bacterium]